MVEVVGMPSLWAVRTTLVHCFTVTFLRDSMCRTSSSRTSAAVPGRVSRPLSFSICR